LVVSPSVVKAGFYSLGQELQDVVDAGAEWLHFSVQDGRMVPKISIGAPVIASLRDHFPETVFDVKLGVVEPEHRVAEFVKAGADIVSVHPEATLQLPAVIHLITAAECAAGVVLNPGTPVSAIEPVLELVDVVVIMLVNPGHGGPKYIDIALRKIAEVKRLCAERGVDPWIEVDGGDTPKNAEQLIQAGANALVAGGSIFEAKDKRTALRELRPSEFQP
jgi:ribulose-phosphate 3-epimerase